MLQKLHPDAAQPCLPVLEETMKDLHQPFHVKTSEATRTGEIIEQIHSELGEKDTTSTTNCKKGKFEHQVIH